MGFCDKFLQGRFDAVETPSEERLAVVLRVLTVVPTGSVPVASEIRGTLRDCHDVADANRNVLVAAGAKVGLVGLKRLDRTHFGIRGIRGVGSA